MTQVLRLSKSNKNALDNKLDRNQLIFSSEYNTLNIIKKRYFTFTAAIGNNTYSNGHLQNYIPFVTGFVKVSGTSEAICPNEGFDNILYRDLSLFSVTADKTNINFEIQNNTGSSQVMEATYFIFEIPL